MKTNIHLARKVLSAYNEVMIKQKITNRPRIEAAWLPAAHACADPVEANITINSFLLKFRTMSNIKRTMAHELKHIEQFEVIARYLAGVAKNINQGLENFKALAEETTKLTPLKNMDGKFAKLINEELESLPAPKFNEQFYKRAIEQKGVITENSPLFERAQKLFHALKNYPDQSILTMIQKVNDNDAKNSIKYVLNNLKLYNANPLEVEAVKAAKELKI